MSTGEVLKEEHLLEVGERAIKRAGSVRVGEGFGIPSTAVSSGTLVYKIMYVNILIYTHTFMISSSSLISVSMYICNHFHVTLFFSLSLAPSVVKGSDLNQFGHFQTEPVFEV